MTERDPPPAPLRTATGRPTVGLIGHDLRAAISDIIGGLRLVDPDALDGATRLQFERIRAASETLARLVEGGLTEIVGEASAPLGQTSNMHLSRLLQDIEARSSGRALEKHIRFTLDAAEDLPRVVALGRMALERILSNVLSNAFKYTDEGGITLSLRCDGEDALIFRIRDDGPGFDTDALARLFQYAGRPHHAGKPGLGLHIAKEMADRLGAEISVRNCAPRGAEVTLRLPARAWAPLPQPAEGAAPLPDLSRFRVFVADDSPPNQTVIGHMLAALGAEYELASDGMEALGWLERKNFDLALIDIEMPRLSGIEVLRHIRASGGRHAKMPVMAVTAYVLRANREAIYNAGADFILAKPIAGIETFGRGISDLLNRAGTPPSPPPAEDGPEDGVVMDHERFQKLLDICGPDCSAELLSRLLGYLREVERGLVHGLSEPDRALNAAAHRNDAGAVSTLATSTLDLLDDLIHFISGQAALTRESP